MSEPASIFISAGPGTSPVNSQLVMLSLVFSGLLGLVCYLIAGNSLDLFIGGLFLTTLLAPPLAAIARSPSGVVCCAVAVTVGFGCSWFFPVWERTITAGQWMSCLLVLCSYLAALGFAMLFLLRLGCRAVAGCAAIVAIAFGWLSCPIWLSGVLSGAHLRWSVLLHPLFVMNGVLPQLGIWTEQQVAYGLTSLGQDVQYELPRSPWPLICVQSAIAVLLYIACIAPRSTIQMDSEAKATSKK